VEVLVLWITEEWVLGDVSVDPELILDATYPVAALITVEITAVKKSGAAAFAQDGSSFGAKGNDGVIEPR
jgi:hypothetical protein